MHPLLKRQLRKLSLDAEKVPTLQEWTQLLERIGRTYGQGDQDRYTIERSLMVSSREIQEMWEKASISEERYRVLFDGMPLPIVLFDPTTLQIIQANDAALRLYGYSEEELLALTMLDLKVERDDPELQRVADAAPDAGAKQSVVPWRGVKRHRRKDGSTLDLDITSHVITVGGRRAVLAQNVDVTEKLRLEDQLRQSQKMEAVGRLAGGIAHDFNNILAVILADADYAKEELGEHAQVKPLLEEIEAAATRAASLTHQLLAFSRRQVLQPRVLSLNIVVSDMERMLRRIIGEDVKLEIDLDSTLSSVKADPGQIEQVIMNLVVNARDALDLGGRVTVRTENVHGGGGPVPSEIGADCVVLTVSDDGSGMDAQTVARIFEPFFTTKKIGKGTGLGLATVFGIVKQSGGVVHVESELGRGSSFKVFLPRVDEPARRVEGGSLRVEASGCERVLLVEDDPHVRRAVTQALERRGYKVEQANDGEDAVCRFRGAHAFDIVVTDLVMPGMDGVAVVK
ncbi:MAG: hybrid sensor histidine kinase/response regulator, partial [Polyangiaceae bacterium]